MPTTTVSKSSRPTIESDLAESWEATDNNLVWTFKLRKGVQWQHGYGEVFPWYVTGIAVCGLIAVLFMHDNREHSTIDNPGSSAYGKRRAAASS